MAQRPAEVISIECERGSFDRFRKIEVSTDIFGEASCTFEVADDRAWRPLYPLLAHGKPFSVYAAGGLVFTGRVDDQELPTSIDDGTTIQVVLRTRLADARMGSANPSVRVSNTSIRDFVVALYARHKFTLRDFLFTPDTDRDLVTGRKLGLAPPVDLEPFKADAAKVLPTETTFDAAKRHLERHHLLQWDAATGLICVGLPNDTQRPLYRFVQRGGVCNFREGRPVRDWSEVPSSLHVLGGGVGKATLRAPFVGLASDVDLLAVSALGPNFLRGVFIEANGVKDLKRAQAQARRELMVRSRRKVAWEITLDDWSYWTGSYAIPYAINTVADLDIETHVGTPLNGPMLVTGCKKTLDAESGARTVLTLLGQGLINPPNG